MLSGPLNRLNAILSLLRPLDHYRTPPRDRECDWEALSRPVSHLRTGSSQLPHPKTLRGARLHDSSAIVSKALWKQVRNRNVIEAALEIAAIFAIYDCDAHRGSQKSQRFPRQDKAMPHCDLRVRWKVASNLRFRAAISEPKAPSFCRISGDLAPSTRKSLAIAIVRFWCAKRPRFLTRSSTAIALS